MYKIVNTLDDNKNPQAKTDIFTRSKNLNSGANAYTTPIYGDFLKSEFFKNFNVVNNGIKEVAVPAGEASSLKDAAENLATTLLLPPSEDYSTIIPPEGKAAAKQIEQVTKKQFIQQFYETYMVPVGGKDIYNRLGTIAGNIANIHSLYPEGIKGLIAADNNASWRVNLNYAFTVDEGLHTKAYKYSSLSFPPFISHEAANIKDFTSKIVQNETVEQNALDKSFDMENVIYKGNKGTFRFPAFKQVNDNINTVQLLLNRCFGIESTYINEWDLSMYMQEGLMSYIEKQDEDGTIRLPQFVTTVTYGLMDDAPIDELNQGGKSANKDSSLVDIDKITPFASLNLAVSTRYAIDNEAIGQQSNTLNYIIADYPYSAYWYPPDEGSNTIHLNVSKYIDDMLAYNINGEAYDETAPFAKAYTPGIFHGEDLSKSKKPLLDIIKYTDGRNAILSGWNSTNVQGKPYLSYGDRTNESSKSNAFSYLPFWKQFYTNEEDGLSDVDKYIQEVYAKDSETSFLNAAYQIINLITAENSKFNDVLDDRRAAKDKQLEDAGFDTDVNQTIADKYGAESYSDMSFKIMKVKLKIPGSKLLSMFLNKSKVSNKAKSMADNLSVDTFDEPNAALGASTSPTSALNSVTPTKELGEKTTTVVDGQEVEVSTYIPEDSDDLASKKTVGDGIAEWSPMLYGGPHGKYYSPLTLEGYTQDDNQMLANVPTVDTLNTLYSTNTNLLVSQVSNVKMNARGIEFSKNYKKDGSYIDTVTALTPNERVSLINRGYPFGVIGLKPNTGHWSSYYSNEFYRELFWHDSRYITFKIFRWRIRIPNFFYFKTFRNLNSNYNRWLGFTYDYGTSSYRTRLDTTRWETDESVQEDWTSEDFRLIPTAGETDSLYWNNRNCGLNSEQTKNRILKDEALFRKMTSFDKEEVNAEGFGTITYSYKANYLPHHNSTMPKGNVKYLIVPTSEGSTITCGYGDYSYWNHWTPYSTPGTKWYSQLKNLWYSGTRETSVTLPIVDYNASGKPITNIVRGVVNIVKSTTLTWSWKLVSYGSHTYRRHGCSWCCPHRVTCYHWSWVQQRTYIDIFNMYFRPEKVIYSIPTKHLLEKEAKYSNQRDKSTSNIIQRWCTDAPKDVNAIRFSSISDGINYSPVLFPFTWDFMVRYGEYNPNLNLPGVNWWDNHTRPAKDIRILHSKGLYYGDILESYREKGHVESIKSVRPVYETFISERSFVDTAAGGRFNVKLKLGRYIINFNWASGFFNWLFGRIVENMYSYKATSEFLWTAYNPDYVVDEKATQQELTDLLNEVQLCPTVQEYQIGDKPYMTWYQPKDTLGVFIDTVTQQIEWLYQLRDFADLYLSDALIYDLYTKGTDNKIKNIVRYQVHGNVKNNKNYKEGCGGWTESFTEDINYYDALAIVEKAFRNPSSADQNTIYDLVCKRIERLKAIKDYAESLEKNFEKDPTTMNKFTIFVTNVKAYLNNAVNPDGTSAEDFLFSPTGGVSEGELFEVTSSTTYNILKNPAALTWAYLNVLYQVRKYWVNMRLNKRAGSYWTLRSLERVLTFFLAEDTGEDTSLSSDKHIPQGTLEELKTKDIVFVQTRESFTDQSESEATINSPNTKAIYLKVNYIGTPEPTKSAKWNEEKQTYNGEEICYVNEAYRWAKKPQDGLYYIMSKSISEFLSKCTGLLKTTIDLIFAKTYKVTSEDLENILVVMQNSDLDYSELGIDKGFDENNRKIKANFEDFKKYLMLLEPEENSLSKIFETAKNVTEVSSQICQNTATYFTNVLMQYKRDYYFEQIQSYLFAIYIRWHPEQVWTGLREDDETGAWHIDEWQKQETSDPEKYRTVTDLYGYEHSSNEAISAGITFDVSAAIDAGTLLSSPENLKNSSLLEILCSSVDKMDLWRVEIPEALSIPANLLKEKPVLIPAYQIDASLNGLKSGKVTKSQKSVLAGIATNAILPITEPTEAMLSINTLSALGKFEAIASAGLNVETIVNSGN